MEDKKHYKLYKSGKLWMTAMISAAILGSAEIVHADVAEQNTITTPADTSEVITQSNDLNKSTVIIPQTTNNQSSNEQEQSSTAPASANSQEKVSSAASEQTTTQKNTAKAAANSGKEQSSSVAPKNADSKQGQTTVSKATPAPAMFTTESQVVSTRTQPQADSTITVSNPSNYPTTAAKLVGQNSAGQAYYIYQIVNLNSTSVNDRPARMILAVDPANPQGNNYVYVTDDRYSKVEGSVYMIAPGTYADIRVGSTGSNTPNANNSRVFRVSNTEPFSLDFNGKTIQLPASASIRSKRTVSPVYGLGNQKDIDYVDKVDITPELNNPAIEYIYRDKDGNYTTNIALPANVPVNGITGQRFLITNVNNYKKVVTGYYLTNQKGSLSNTANGTDYQGTISQFQIGKYYQKTLYDWNRNISEQLIYELIDPQGTMDISLVRSGFKTETKRVAVGKHDQFSNGTLARNPFVPGANAVQLVYADLGHIIPVDENGNVISQDQPIYNNDPTDPHKAAATDSPDLTAQGWVLSDPKNATITPADPGADTKVQYRKVVPNISTKTVTQTVKYVYADGVTEGRPALPADNVQTADFTHTVITNPVTGAIISDTWTPAQQFTAVTSPKIDGFYADFASVGGNNNVTHETGDTTFIVEYAGPNETVEHETVTQTVKYAYKDNVTEGRPALPQDNVQSLSFTRTIKTDPAGNIISDVWTPDQTDNQFTAVKSPSIRDEATDTNYYYDTAVVGGNPIVNQTTPDTQFIVYYLPGNITTQSKVITQTVHYEYKDGVTQGRPSLPADNVQKINFEQTVETNPFTGDVMAYSWDPAYSQFSSVKTPEVNGFYADQAQAGGDEHVIPEDSDTNYIVYYVAPVSTVTEEKQVNQTIRYEYADGVTANRPTLPSTNVQTKVFYRTVTTNPWNNEVISDTWTPAQYFTVIQTPEVNGFYASAAQAGNDTEAITQDSSDTDYLVKYAPAKTSEETKTVTQTIRYHYAEGVDGDPALLPKDNVQQLTFTRTTLTNPWTDELISDTWSPAQKFSVVETPSLTGYYADQTAAGSEAAVTYESPDTTYDVYYYGLETTQTTKTITQTIKYKYADGVVGDPAQLPKTNVQSLTFTQTIKRNPHTGAVVSTTWSPAQKFTVVETPSLTGYYADQAVAGSEATVTHESPDTEYVVLYAPAKTTTETKDVAQTIRYEYADGQTAGRPTLPDTNVQHLTFTRTTLTNPWTDELISDTWSPAQKFTVVETPTLAGYYADQATAGSAATVTHESPDTEYVVLYAPAKTATETKNITQTVRYHYAAGVTGDPAQLPKTNVQSLTFTRTTLTNPWNDEVISDSWSPAQKFTVVETPTLAGYYADQATAGSEAAVTHESPDMTYDVYYYGPETTQTTKTITQTIKYEYAAGVAGDPAQLPKTNVQSLTFTQTIKRNPHTGAVVSATWSPAQKFSVVTTPTLAGYYADQAAAGSAATVTHESPDTEYVVLYAPAKTTTEAKNVTQTVRYHYAAGVTGDSAQLPKTNVQSLTFTRTILTNPWNDEVISDSWSPAQKFTVVETPSLNGYYADQATAGSEAAVTYESPDTTYDVYYYGPETTQTTKTITQTIRYEYADGITGDPAQLPKTNVQSLTFIQTIKRNPHTGAVVSDSWSPAQKFTVVTTPTLAGYYADQAAAGSAATVTHESSDTEYVVLYAPAKTTTDTKDVTQTIRYEYADGQVAGRPTLPDTNVQHLTFTRTTLTNPWNNEVISDSWSPAQTFTVVATPTIKDYFANHATAGSAATVTHDSPDTEYVVQYAPGKVTTENKTVTQTVKYEYADGETEGRPTLPADNTITVDFTHTIIRNPFTDEVVSDTWSPAQTIDPVKSPIIEGFTPDQAEVPGKTINYDSTNLEYVVKYTQVEEPSKPTPEEPVTPEPEKPNEPAEEEPNKPQPAVPVPEESVQQPEKPNEPVETPAITTTKPAEQSSIAQNKETKPTLPQTGNRNSTAIAGLGLVTAFISLFGFGKRKHEN